MAGGYHAGWAIQCVHDTRFHFKELRPVFVRDLCDFRGRIPPDHPFLDVRRTAYYSATVIRSFRSKDAELIFQGLSSKRFNRLVTVIERKLVQIHAATTLSDISIFPGNRLEALKGSRLGQHSIRINDQYRLCFVWKDGDAYEVEIVDYH
jgi:proteic killer suppression protein